jgi:hypothetical protein
MSSTVFSRRPRDSQESGFHAPPLDAVQRELVNG